MSNWLGLVMAGVIGCTSIKDDTGSVGGDGAPQLDDTGSDVDGDGDEGADGDGDADEGPPDEAITWHEHVKPLMDKHCTRCHYDAGLGVGDFTDPVLVRNFADIMLSRIDSGDMPPPVSDPECRDYLGSDHLQMPVESRDLFAAWIEGGKEEGSPEDAPVSAPISETLAEPNMTVQIPQPYVPLYEDTENPGNEYRCFVIDPEIEENIYITALAPTIDQKAMVHHVVLFTKHVDDIPAHEAGPEGYDCIDAGMADGVNGLVAGWAPGALPVEFPDGYGMRLGPNDRLVLQMHYYQSGPDVVGVADQSGYAFRVVDEVDRSVLMYPLGTTSFTIPAGDPSYTDGFEWPMPSFLSFDILAVFPHMHILGTGYKMWANTAEAGRTCLAQSDRYDFDNQLTYLFKEPISIQGGDTIGFECTWDNSAENPNQFFDVPQDIRYGERTDEEMCFTFTLVGI